MSVIVFEGPDGGGKDTAIDQVRHRWPDVPLLERASDSLTGPVPQLDAWVTRHVDILNGAEVAADGLYNRHPLISELVYAPVLRGAFKGRFNDPLWLRSKVGVFSRRVVVVWCMPPLQRVRDNVYSGNRKQMAGVLHNIDNIYAGYQAARATWPGGRNYTHDYTTDPSGMNLCAALAPWLPHTNNGAV